MLRERLIKQMADGRYHSGEALCRSLGISRHALWKTLNSLGDVGLAFHAAPGQGYRLDRACELLDRAVIMGILDPMASLLLADLEVLGEVDSTNRHLLDRSRQGLPGGHACVAEFQSRGRGRRGRGWVSPYGCNLYLSLLWDFHGAPRALSALGVACAVAVGRALQGMGLNGIGLKWPNDILWRGRKLGGVLLEFVDAMGGPRRGVIGVGLNVGMPEDAARNIHQPWADVETARGAPVSRNQLAGVVLENLLKATEQFQAAGVQPFIEEWRQYDIMPGKSAVLRWHDGHVCGIVEGVSPEGELILSVDGVTRNYAYGEVSLRAAS